MKISKSPKIETSFTDDFLYERIIILLKQIKLVRGANELAFTLRNHKTLHTYLYSKQISLLNDIETTFFNEDGSINSLAIQNHNIKNRSLQN